MNISTVGKDCTGCTSCVNSCPKSAISMKEDEEGFLYPVIDEQLCVNCGICNNKCPIDKETDIIYNRISSYYGSADDESIVLRSSSGGAYTLLANYVINNGGQACGAVINYETKEVEYSDTDRSSLDEIRRSKYVASNPKDIFLKTEEELKSGRKVLFCGLPCHVAGLRRYLGRDYENLIVVDFPCGGVASPRFFKEHLHLLEKKYNSKVKGVNFRAKLYGWKPYSIQVDFEDGSAYKQLAMKDIFFRGFFEKTYQRDSCYHCRYRLSHESDIIVADYWGGVKLGRCNNEGVSMVIANTTKGDSFLKKALDQPGAIFTSMPVSDSDYAFQDEKERYDKAYLLKKDFYNIYRKKGFITAAKKIYFSDSIIKKLFRKLKK